MNFNRQTLKGPFMAALQKCGGGVFIMRFYKELKP